MHTGCPALQAGVRNEDRGPHWPQEGSGVGSRTEDPPTREGSGVGSRFGGVGFLSRRLEVPVRCPGEESGPAVTLGAPNRRWAEPRQWVRWLLAQGAGGGAASRGVDAEPQEAPGWLGSEVLPWAGV